jgi:hypothetical protein
VHGDSGGCRRKKILGLAIAAKEHHAELTADFQRFYGLNFDDVGRGIDPARAVELVEMLPAGSRYGAAVNPESEWSDAEYLAASMEYSLRVLAWQQTKDGAKGRNQPKRVKLPGEESTEDKVEGTDIDGIDAALGGM